jgi:hypothetical protein
MVAELNMVCHNRYNHLQYQFKDVKPVDFVAAVRQCVEILTTQKEPQQLGNQITDEFLDVFSEIPHINELPTNVYCYINLKDVSKSIQTWTYSTP